MTCARGCSLSEFPAIWPLIYGNVSTNFPHRRTTNFQQKKSIFIWHVSSICPTLLSTREAVACGLCVESTVLSNPCVIRYSSSADISFLMSHVSARDASLCPRTRRSILNHTASLDLLTGMLVKVYHSFLRWVSSRTAWPWRRSCSVLNTAGNCQPVDTV